MSHLPRDVIAAIQVLNDLIERHDLDSLSFKLHRRPNTALPGDGSRTTAEFQIGALGHYWHGHENGEETYLEGAWEERVANRLEREIKLSVESLAEMARQKKAKAEVAEKAGVALEKQADRARRLVPDVVTELGQIAEDLPIEDPTIDNVQFIHEEDNCADHDHDWAPGDEPARECGCPADPGIHGCHPNVCNICDISEEDYLDSLPF